VSRRTRHGAAWALVAFVATLVLAPSALASPARIAWFYKPPVDGSSAAEVVAGATGQLILTKRDEAFRDQLRSAGYGAPILQYIEAAYVHGPSGVLKPGDPCDASFAPWGNNVAWDQGDFCRYVHPNEDWFVHNGRGERLVNGYYTGGHGTFYAMNPASAGWRAFYASRVRQALFGDATTGPLGYDGIFLDDVWMTRHQLLNRVHNADGAVREFSSDADLRTAVVGLIQTVREAAAGRPVHANTDGNDFYGAYLDGTMREDFAASWNGAYMDAQTVSALWVTAERASADGKSLLLVGQGARDDLDRMRFAFGAYLMVAGPGISFRYTGNSAGYRELWRYPEYAVDLGAPVEPRALVAGSTWRRQFSNGIALVNLSASSPQIVDLGAWYLAADGTILSSLTLPPQTGAVLTRSLAETPPSDATPLTNTTAPEISGLAVEGSTLEATSGSWSMVPTKLEYGWLRCNAAGGSCTAIARATKSSYRVRSADVGKTLRASVTATAVDARASADSAPTLVVTAKRKKVVRTTSAVAAKKRAATMRKAAATRAKARRPARR